MGDDELAHLAPLRQFPGSLGDGSQTTIDVERLPRASEQLQPPQLPVKVSPEAEVAKPQPSRPPVVPSPAPGAGAAGRRRSSVQRPRQGLSWEPMGSPASYGAPSPLFPPAAAAPPPRRPAAKVVNSPLAFGGSNCRSDGCAGCGTPRSR